MIENDVILSKYTFQEGQVLNKVVLHYTTLGSPKYTQGRIDNAVLFLHGTGSSSQDLLTPEFYSAMYGRGKVLDTEKYYIVLPDAIGHGRSSNPIDTGLFRNFPKYTYQDMVHLQYILIRHLGITHFQVIMGTSMGGMHTWLWGILYPEMMDMIIPIVCYPYSITGRNLLWRRIIIRNIDEGGSSDISGSILHMMLDGVPQLQRGLPDVKSCTVYIDRSSLKERDLNLRYALDASRDYHPQYHLDQIRARILSVNFSDDEINPPELDILETYLRPDQYILIPDTTYGHGTAYHPSVWTDILQEYM